MTVALFYSPILLNFEGLIFVEQDPKQALMWGSSVVNEVIGGQLINLFVHVQKIQHALCAYYISSSWIVMLCKFLRNAVIKR